MPRRLELYTIEAFLESAMNTGINLYYWSLQVHYDVIT